jgi:hypothetical protein
MDNKTIMPGSMLWKIGVAVIRIPAPRIGDCPQMTSLSPGR